MIRPFLNKERITDFENFDRHAKDAIGQAAARLAAGYPIDFQVRIILLIYPMLNYDALVGYGVSLYDRLGYRIPFRP